MKFSFPAVQGIQAGRPFYQATVPFNTLPRLLEIDSNPTNVLARSQREVNLTRARKVCDYLSRNTDSFMLPSLTGNIDSDGVVFYPCEESPSVGTLEVPMDAIVKLFDGQTRATGIAMFLRYCDENDLPTPFDQVTVQLFVNLTLEERQQAFADINGNASKPTASLNATYDHRSEGCSLAVSLATKVPAFNGYIDFERSTASADKLFPLKSLQDATLIFLGLGKNASIEHGRKVDAQNFWTEVSHSMGWLEHMDSEEVPVEQWRQNSIAGHAVTLCALAMAGKHMVNKQDSSTYFAKLSTVDWSRSAKHWLARCVDHNGNMVKNTKAIKLTAAYILSHVGIHLIVEPEFGKLEHERAKLLALSDNEQAVEDVSNNEQAVEDIKPVKDKAPAPKKRSTTTKKRIAKEQTA